MKISVSLLLLFVAALTPLFGQWMPETAGGGRPLNAEELRLLEAFRGDPEPFRRIMAGAREAETARFVDDQTTTAAIVGPRDLIDVTVSGGKVAFYGRRQTYSPAGIRLRRGQTGYITFSRDNSAVETRVRVSFRTDGLHFDVREPYGGTTVEPRGFIVVQESAAWRRGDPIPWAGMLTDARSLSRAENISFQIRYVER